MARHCPAAARASGTEHAELRLVAERAEQQAGHDRAAIDRERRRPEQAGRQKRVLPEADVPEYHRKGAERDERRAAAVAENAACDDEIEDQRRRFEDDESDQVGQPRQRGAQQDEHWRVVEKLVLDAGGGDVLLGGQMRRAIVGQRRRTGIGEDSGRIEADEIGRRRSRQRHDPAMRAGDDETKDRELDRQQHRAAPANAAPVEERTQLCRQQCAVRPHHLGPSRAAEAEVQMHVGTDRRHGTNSSHLHRNVSIMRTVIGRESRAGQHGHCNLRCGSSRRIGSLVVRSGAAASSRI